MASDQDQPDTEYSEPSTDFPASIKGPECFHHLNYPAKRDSVKC